VAENETRHVPFFIQKQLENPPVLPGENPRDFRALFYEIEDSAEGGAKSAADHMIDYQATVLIWNLQRIERMLVALIGHMRSTAVVALIGRSSEDGEPEPGSHFYRLDRAEALEYFSSEEAKKRIQERFVKAGYAPDAVEVEAFAQALPQIISLNRQQTAARQQLLAFLKEIDRRNSRRAKELRKVADKVMSRAGDSAPTNGGVS
jgi:uncharacterized protein YdiU (UPF0061 family)